MDKTHKVGLFSVLFFLKTHKHQQFLFMLMFYCALFSCLSLYPFKAWGEPPTEKVVLDAERVAYDDETGKASAEGDAVLSYQGMTIRAERIDYDAVSQKVKASPMPGESVILQGVGKQVTGDALEYDLNSREGVLQGAKSSFPLKNGTLRVWGAGLEVLPYSLAVERGLVKEDKRAAENGSYIGYWEDVAATTCALDHPHYRIVAKSITFIPGRSVIAKRPKIYLGDTFVFTYPMDYIVNINRKALKYSVMPFFENSTQKGTGMGLSGAYAWSTGFLSLGFAYWSDIDLEWMSGVEQSLGGGFWFRGGIEYSWDESWNQKSYRFHSGLWYEDKGWTAGLRWTWNEFITDQKDSLHKYKGRLSRRPEFTLSSPWFKDPALMDSSWVRFSLAWGQYKEETVDFSNDPVGRYGVKLQSYFEMPLFSSTSVVAFSNTQGTLWFYDKNGMDQQVLESLWGVRYGWGWLELASAYERRSVWGESPMLWDSYREIQRLHQKVRFPLGREVFLAVRGSYDLNESMIDEVNYALQWISDCMKWELTYRNDRTSGGEDRINLNVVLLAFPNTPASFGQYADDDPFERPQNLNNDK